MINISHDLRTPLTSALGYIDIVVNDKNILEPDVNINLGTKYISILINKYQNC